MHDNIGQFQGTIMIFDDVSEKEEIQAELRKKELELTELDIKFQDVLSKFQLVEQDRFSRNGHQLKVGNETVRNIEHVGNILDEKNRDLEKINSNIIAKTDELKSINSKIMENKTKLIDIENEIAQKKIELEFPPKSEEDLSKTFKDKLKIIDEIDKSLGISEGDPLKTKKIDPENDDK
jgi:hypothetical protein